jgi:hypothetical protein
MIKEEFWGGWGNWGGWGDCKNNSGRSEDRPEKDIRLYSLKAH